MIASLHGIVLEKSAESIVIECGGIGFEAQVSSHTLAMIPEIGAEARLLTYFQVREDAMQLFGFSDKDEKAMFVKLIGVTGVGPKMAMSILSTLSVSELAGALVGGDARALSRVPGVGKRTAERLIVELKERIDNNFITGAPVAAAPAPVSSLANDLVDSLIALGWTYSEASGAINSALAAGYTDEGAILSAALSSMDRGKK